MGNEERERKFEQALERHLRRNIASARNEADAHADVRNETGGAVTCLDAETLAAFHEQILSREEMNIAAEHIESCSRCQQILMQLEATDEIPLQAEPGDIFAKREPVLSTGAQYVDEAAMQTPGPRTAGQPKAASKAPKDISRGRGFRALRWAAPAGAIAAGLLVWFVVRDSKVQTLGHVENVQVAQEQPINGRLTAPRALPASPAPERMTKSKQLNEPRKDAGKIKRPSEESGAQRAPERQLSDAFSTRDDLDVRAETSDAGVPAASRESKLDALQSVTRAKPESRASSQNKVAAVSAAKAAAVPAPAPSRDQHTQSAAPIETPPTVSTVAPGPARSQSAVPAPPASSGASANAADKKAGETPTQTVVLNCPLALPVPTERMATPDKLHEPALETRGRTAPDRKIVAPGAIVLWRLGAKGQIERSVDGGASWVRQSSGVKSELLGGAAPSESVCWIIGRGGTILKTTDGGVHWSKVAWPNAGEITGIQAFDAMHAIVYGGTADIPGRFATNDGGATWFRPNK
jgi:Photosynthesis system II assembly factor YCF48